MGLLEQLWDDTVAGPRPDSGLSRLRKYPSSSSFSPAASDPVTILRSKSFNPRNLTVDTGSPSTDSPLTPGTPRSGWRRKPAAQFLETAEPRSPTVYDWMVISALDR